MSDHSTENTRETMAEGLLKAIKAERYGHNFYLMAANSTEDPKGKEIFQTLAREELDHMHFLRKQYDAILKTGQPDNSIRLGPQSDLTGMSPIFSESLKGRIKEASFEMTSLAIGIQLEHDAMQFYRAEAEAASDLEVKSFFSKLSDWEAGHYRALLRQQEELKEDYWLAGGFAPM
ncbi:MAG: ferritin family protein [candidate division Zixibacteria bacterium]|nr:ferritin family protein [candidate division Zixibacteria bacterium]